MKFIIYLLAALVLFLGYRVFKLENEISTLQRSAAIAVLSAEIANKKVGAIAPYFAEDKNAFANAWIDEINMPPAEFPEEILVPLHKELAQKREDSISQKLREETFKD